MSRQHDAIKGPQWDALRIDCFARDDYTCQSCGATSDLQVDHIKPLSLYPELALDLANLRTLCGPCNRAKSDTIENIERLPWLHLEYAELHDLVFLENNSAIHI